MEKTPSGAIPQAERSPISSAFTLIELLVVISVIGILATVLLARFGTVEKSGRDTRRKSDLNQYRTALENYSIKTGGVYPSYTTAIDASGSLCTTLGTSYIATCVQDPRQDGSTYYYRYLSNGSGSGTVDATQYMLWAYVETGGTTPYLYVCASGKIAQKASAPVAADCW